MAIRRCILALALLPFAVLAAEPQSVPESPVAVTRRVEAESGGQVPLNGYNESHTGHAAYFCADRVCDTPPMLLSAAAPVYPMAMIRKEMEGEVMLRFDINEAGTPVNVVVESATTPEFATAAVRAVAAWRFEPAVLRGKPVDYRGIRQSFPFELHY